MAGTNLVVSSLLALPQFPPSQNQTLAWLRLHFEDWFTLFPQLYGRHKEYLSSLVGTDFEMVSSSISCSAVSC